MVPSAARGGLLLAPLRVLGITGRDRTTFAQLCRAARPGRRAAHRVRQPVTSPTITLEISDTSSISSTAGEHQRSKRSRGLGRDLRGLDPDRAVMADRAGDGQGASSSPNDGQLRSTDFISAVVAATSSDGSAFRWDSAVCAV